MSKEEFSRQVKFHANKTIFHEYKGQGGKQPDQLLDESTAVRHLDLSVNDLLAVKEKNLQSKIFEVKGNKIRRGSEIDAFENHSQNSKQILDQESKYGYVQIKKRNLQLDGSTKVMLQVIDISSAIMYDQAQAKTEVLQLINATVSHEMRNPLNSIMNQIFKFMLIITALAAIIQSVIALEDQIDVLPAEQIVKMLRDLKLSAKLKEQLQ